MKVLAATVAVAVLLLAHAPAASSRKLQMSGTWALRTGKLFVPLQFADDNMSRAFTSLGDLSKGFFFPQGPIPGAGVVTATGSWNIADELGLCGALSRARPRRRARGSRRRARCACPSPSP